MRMDIYIARVWSYNSDAYTASYNRDAALKAAEQYKAHLTPKELINHYVALETYKAVYTELGRSAKRAYTEALMADEIGEPDEYIPL